jgi:hypothetical protein
VEGNTLEELVAWGSALAGFRRSYATDALTLVNGYLHGVTAADGRRVEGIGMRDERSALLLSIDLAWLLWLDDRFDGGTDQEIHWEDLARSVKERCDLEEAKGFALVRAAMVTEAGDGADYRFWLEATIAVFRAYHLNELFSRGEKACSYAEYLQNGETSIAALQFLATLSLVYRLALSERLRDARFQRMMRNLCLAMRLQNDLASADKERDQHDHANAVLILEKALPRTKAVSFVFEERQGYERLLREDMRSLAPTDPYLRIIEILLASTELYYQIPRERYATRNVPSRDRGSPR